MKDSICVHIPAFIAIRTVLNTMVRMIYPFLPVFGRGLGVDLWVLSLAVTFRSAAGIFGPFLASIADSRGRKAGMIFGLLLFTAGVTLISIWHAYPAFVLALVLTIVGNFVFIPSMQAYLGDRVSYQKRGRALALTEFGWSLSFILGVPLIGLLIARWGWLAPFPVLAGAGLLAMLVLGWLLPSDPGQVDGGSPGLWQNFRTVFTCPPALAGLVMGASLSAANEVINLIFGVWMEDSFGLKIAALGAASAILGISELGGESLVGILTDRLGKPASVGAGLILNSLAALALSQLGNNLAGALAGLFFFYISFEFSIVSTIPLMTEVIPHARASLMATYIAFLSIGRMLGDLLAPPLYSVGKASGILPGILATTLVAVAFNLLAMLALYLLSIFQYNQAYYAKTE